MGGTKNLPFCQDVPAETYHENARDFCPEPGAPRQWIERAARAGARYAVLTTKHHDGFALWPTKQSDFGIAMTRYRGDLVGEYVDACREFGLRVGFYFSLCDWHHPDYPPFRDEHRPYRYGMEPAPDEAQWVRYRAFLEAQLEELLTGYGEIDLLWFDGGWERPAQKWGAADLEKTIRRLQPEIWINDRLPTVGDFETPEQFIPPQPLPRKWETCFTMNESWAWNPEDTRYKSSRELVHALCETVGRGGNLLLNVSPRGDGSLPPEQEERLDELARWMDAHASAIHDAAPGLEPWQFYGPSTRKGDRLYLFLLLRPYEGVSVRGISIKRVRAVRDLRRGVDLPFTTRCSVLDQLFNSDPRGELSFVPPHVGMDPRASVVEIELSDHPLA